MYFIIGFLVIVLFIVLYIISQMISDDRKMIQAEKEEQEKKTPLGQLGINVKKDKIDDMIKKANGDIKALREIKKILQESLIKAHKEGDSGEVRKLNEYLRKLNDALDD